MIRNRSVVGDSGVLNVLLLSCAQATDAASSEAGLGARPGGAGRRHPARVVRLGERDGAPPGGLRFRERQRVDAVLVAVTASVA